jgi:quercetin dioxygenase-like cupin family protein
MKNSDTNAPLEWINMTFKTLLSADDTAGSIGIFENVCQPGSGPPRHIHKREDEIFYILSGEAEFFLDGKTALYSAGDTVFVPRGKEHAFQVIGNRPLRMLTIFTPGGFEAFFSEMAEKNLQIPQDMQQVAQIGSQYHMDFTGPPLGR